MLIDFVKITGTGPRRRRRTWNPELAKGYSGWNEALVTNAVSMYREAQWHGWAPPAPHEAEHRWHDLPIGGVLTRPWSRPSYTRAARAIPPRGRRSRPAPRPQQHRSPRRG